MRSTIFGFLLLALAGAAAAEETAIPSADETRNAEPVPEETKAAADTAAQEPEEFKPPPGFKVKQRGKHTVYCIKTSSMGTRFETETCYDRDQLQAYLLAREQNNADFQRSRAVCATSAVCAPQ